MSWPMRWITHLSASVGRGRFFALASKRWKWRLREAHGELVDAIKRSVQLGKVRKHESRKPRASSGRKGQRIDLRHDTRMIEREQPWTVSRRSSDPDRTGCGGRAIAQPASFDAAFDPEPTVPSCLLRLRPHDKPGRVLRRDHLATMAWLVS